MGEKKEKNLGLLKRTNGEYGVGGSVGWPFRIFFGGRKRKKRRRFPFSIQKKVALSLDPSSLSYLVEEEEKSENRGKQKKKIRTEAFSKPFFLYKSVWGGAKNEKEIGNLFLLLRSHSNSSALFFLRESTAH